MQRGVYFDAWYPHQHNYHPSLPNRRLRMIDDLADMRTTMLVWSSMGGGSISLPHLEEEAYGEIPARFRLYGFVNDSEFIAHAAERGISVFGIVFECQGWEFPVEYGADGEILALNELRGVGERGWLGLREFTQNTGPKGWKPFEHYFPDGLTNSLGERVTDLWEECCSRDLEGNPLHAHWVEAPDREHQGYCMDRNNPVWREYLKAIIRIQIDAGVAGVQLDESETPMGAMRYGGCFCKDCMAQFTHYLRGLPGTASDPELSELDLDTFDYRTYLLGQGFKAGDSPRTMPLYHHFCQFLVGAITATYKEMAAYIREYAQSVGRTVKVAGNFFNCFPEYDAMVAVSDVLITEMRITGARQPWWYRHAAGFGQGKDVVVVENPYGGMIPQLLTELNQGKGFDRFRVSIYEGAAMGAGMTLPFGSWLGSEIEDSYWAPKALVDEVGQFLESIDPLRSLVSASEVGVLYSVPGNMQAEIDGDKWDDQGKFFDPDLGAVPPTGYWDVVQSLSEARVPFDTVVLPDERYRPNDVSADRLGRYRVVVLAGCTFAAEDQHQAIVEYLSRGGEVIVAGDYALNLDEKLRREVVEHARTQSSETTEVPAHVGDRQVLCADSGTIAVNLDVIDPEVTALHLINYDFDPEQDRAVALEDLTIEVRVAHPVGRAIVHEPGREPYPIQSEMRDGRVHIVIPELVTYAVVRLEGGTQA